MDTKYQDGLQKQADYNNNKAHTLAIKLAIYSDIG